MDTYPTHGSWSLSSTTTTTTLFLFKLHQALFHLAAENDRSKRKQMVQKFANPNKLTAKWCIIGGSYIKKLLQKSQVWFIFFLSLSSSLHFTPKIKNKIQTNLSIYTKSSIDPWKLISYCTFCIINFQHMVLNTLWCVEFEKSIHLFGWISTDLSHWQGLEDWCKLLST